MPSHLPRFPCDYVVQDSQGRIVALLEVKRRHGTDTSWAQHWYETNLERAGKPARAAVWLVTPDRLYMWGPDADRSTKPRVLDSGPLLAPYFKRLDIPSSGVDPLVFERIVGLWLKDVAEDRPTPHSEVDRELLDILRGGEVIVESAA